MRRLAPPCGALITWKEKEGANLAPEFRPRILLIDDDEDFRQLLAYALAAHEHDLTEAADGKAALTALRKGAFDLVIADYDLPGLTGAEMLKLAIAEGVLGDASTLVITAHPEPKGIPEETPLLRKPLDLEGLLVQIRMILALRRRARAPRPEKEPPSGALPLELVLYVSSNSPASLAARRRIDEVLAGYLPTEFRFQVYDLVEHATSAVRDRVIFAPTLVKRRPSPRAWIVGDFTTDAVVRDLLDMCGVARRE